MDSCRRTADNLRRLEVSQDVLTLLDPAEIEGVLDRVLKGGA